MNLSEFDLNLLVVFDAIYREKNLTRAGQRLNLSQPAISHSLGRLRDAFEDPLFVRHGNQMEPTPLAEELRQNVRNILDLAENTLEDKGRFEPARSTRTFYIGIQDYPMLPLLPRLISAIKPEAPQIKIRTWHLSKERRKTALEDGELDMVIGITQDFGNNIQQQELFRDKEVCIFRKRHPHIGDELPLEQYLEAEFISQAGNDLDENPVDITLKNLGYDRKIRLAVDNEIIIPQLVSKTDYLANIAERVAREFAVQLPINILPIPIPVEEFRIVQYWHVRNQQDEAHSWLRGIVKSAGETINEKSRESY